MLALRFHRAAACGLVLLVPLPVVHAQGEAANDASRPSFAFLRQDEDWSDFDGPYLHWSDELKNMRTSPYVRVTVGGSLRARYERFTGFDFGPPAPADDTDGYLLTRAFVHADLSIDDDQRLFAEIKTAQATDRSLPGGRRGVDIDTLDLQQFFYELDWSGAGGDFELRLGRQMLSFGAQRLVSPLPWGNALRTWDGGALTWSNDELEVTGFYTQFVPVMKTDFNEADPQNALWGLYATRRPQEDTLGTDLYLLGSERDPRTFNGTTGEDQRLTIGLRLFGDLGSGFDLDVETAMQTGEVGDADVDASMFALEVGHRSEPGAMRLFAGLDVATGDDASGGDVETFDPLFPLGHAYLGQADAVGRSNVVALSIGAEQRFDQNWSGRAALYGFRLADDDDALYDAGGRPIIAGGSATSNTVGYELDLRATYTVDARTSFEAGYSYFLGGDALEEAGRDENETFFYLQASTRL
ncbi:hypothetical protein Pla163_27450 [Planctomycetes bacterium Pla163]|uniref:Alginate export domain-containing protein n=1 Tax=Rohdeia mirabilis TaxID=2528008 RepID=A0A518D2A6_9BACT|nr:hypothetical protein Pla163_27450 [Planctomycetes bacterium Pla163]